MPSEVLDVEARAATLAHRTAPHSGAAAVRDVLAHEGLDFGNGPMAAALVFGLSGALDFLFLPLPSHGADMLGVWGTSSWYERDVAAHLGLELELRRTDDASEGLEHVEAALRQGRLPVVWADFDSLSRVEALGRTSHRAVVVAAVHRRQRHAWVATHDRSGVYPVPLDRLAAARSVTAAPTPNRHTTLVYRCTEHLPPLEEAAARGIARAVQNMRAGSRTFAGLRGGPGLAGVDSFAAAVSLGGGALGDRRARDALVACITGPDGVVAGRRLQAAFFAEVANLLDDSAAQTLVAVYERSAERWSDIAVVLAVEQQHAERAMAATELAQDLRLAEHRGVELMESWARARHAERVGPTRR